MQSRRWPPYVMPSPPMVVVMASTALASALITGVDYLLFPQKAEELLQAEQVTPYLMWGGVLTFGVLLAVSGYLVHRWTLTIFRHALLTGVYAAIGLADVYGGVLDYTGAGIRAGAGFLLVQAVLHSQLAIVAWRRWDRDRG